MIKFELNKEEAEIYNSIKDKCLCEFAPVFVKYIYNLIIRYIKDINNITFNEMVTVLHIFYFLNKFNNLGNDYLDTEAKLFISDNIDNFDKIFNEFREVYDIW